MRKLLELFKSNWISFVGSSLATLAFLGMVTGYAANSVGVWSGPYLGLIVLAMAALFAGGLVLIPVGLFAYRRTLRERLSTSPVKPSRVLIWLGVLTLANFLVIASAGTRGTHEMGTVEFCGTACHEVMQPEYDTYFDSPHSGVACVECHVGPGATWYLKSKLNGARQAWKVITDTWEPIHTPLEELRQAKDTCGQCHSPTHDYPDRLRIHHHFDDDGTRLTDVVVMKVGGEQPDGSARGIHWHAHPDTEVSYVHTDEKRLEIPWVRVRRADGSVSTFAAEGFDPAVQPEGTLRTMDCTDCHNRPAHVFLELESALDLALGSGALDARLPSIVPAAKAVLGESHSRDDARSSVREGLTRFYAEQELDDAPSETELDAAADTLARVWLRNVYPERGVEWGSYPSYITHAGCLRCHDDEHADASGELISIDCDSCHAVVSLQEEDPEILKELGLEGTE
jgi:hypothetical protein